jgi:hypothetical protein
MGLTINYKLSVPQNLSSAVVRELAARTALYARKIGCAEVDEVKRVEADTPFTTLLVEFGREEEDLYDSVRATRGWAVEVWPGKGCESALFGLCQYPRRMSFRGRSVPTGYKGGWQLLGFCKTQYASEHGWEHFLKCHRQVISLLDFWRQLGVTVDVDDEGEYWPTRSVEKLKTILRQYNGLIAAVGGMFRDAAAESATGLSVESPIFDYAHFERLEHEGRQEFCAQIAQLQKEARTGLFQTSRPGGQED